MPAIPSRTDMSAVANASTNPAPKYTTPAPDRERIKRFAVSLKTNIRWIKQFLHGSK